jgi:hypothetical protein
MNCEHGLNDRPVSRSRASRQQQAHWPAALGDVVVHDRYLHQPATALATRRATWSRRM